MTITTKGRERCPRNTGKLRLDELIATDTDQCVEWPYARDSHGYGVIRLDGTAIRTHVVACIAAHGPNGDDMEVAHSCRNTSCLNPRHLRWATPSENANDRILHDTWTRGERHGNAKLTDEQVIEIRESYKHGASLGSLGREYGVHRITIRDITRGNHWKHLLAA